MRNLLATTAATLLALCFVPSAPRTAAADTALGTSAWSLEIGTDVGIGDNNAAFAIRRHSGESSAFRFGIAVDLGESDGTGTRSTTGSADVDAAQFSDNGFTVVSVQWMRFAAIRDNVTGTFALGPVVQMRRDSFRTGNGYGQPSFSEFESWSKSTTYGLELGLGVEWFFNRRFSLGGQSGLRATTGKGKFVNIQRSGTGVSYAETETEIGTDVSEITTATGRIQLTGYF